ncbi:hypothetical protein O181_032368 [Austropuccinia psidii MF-1]|uniref:Uncharacterized protein n=1 Tax=Austropuccinia psidii MF-1 TaxID=1389203 RepID=A0A9Q3H5F9_9BASI|nr:hypothetical protein [Austropuccinia psidii MF-1]
MSVSTHAKKAANDDAEPKPSSNDDMYSMLNTLKNEVMSLKSAFSSDAAEIQFLRMALSSPCQPLLLGPHFHIIQPWPTIASCRNLTALLIVLPHSRATGQTSQNG